jgi:Zn-dependent M28 family amino/carboxypeptidase
MRIVAATPRWYPLPETIESALDAVSRDDLRQVAVAVAVPRVYGTAENESVREAIVGRFSGVHADRCRIEVDEVGNVVVGNPRRARILVGAHYDAVPGTPGADDNASAVAVLLSAARAIGPRDDACFVAFNGEECGFVGSRHFVEHHMGQHHLEQVHVLEMVGFTNRLPGSQRNPVPPLSVPTVGDFLGLVGSHRSARVLDHVLGCAIRATIPVYGLYLPDVPLETVRKKVSHAFRSDHAPFWGAGIPALMWTDTAEFRNPNYHRATDTPEALDYDFMVAVTRLLVHSVLSGLQ